MYNCTLHASQTCFEGNLYWGVKLVNGTANQPVLYLCKQAGLEANSCFCKRGDLKGRKELSVVQASHKFCEACSNDSCT